MNEKLVNKLIELGYHISFAESCTGGLMASAIVDIANASSCLSESYITYSNHAKERILKVKKSTIDKYNVVSEEVAYEMCKGLYDITDSEVCVSVTGVAGPSGGTELIPVGTVCFGFCINGHITTIKKEFKDLSRNECRKAAVLFMTYRVLSLISD